MRLEHTALMDDYKSMREPSPRAHLWMV